MKQFKLLQLLILLSVFTLNIRTIKAECSASTPTTAYTNPGGSFNIEVVYNTSSTDTRRITVDWTSGFSISLNSVLLEDVDELNGNSNSTYLTDVLFASSFHINQGDHAFIVQGVVPFGTPCGQSGSFKVKFERKVIGGWVDECERSFTVATNSTGSISITGPSTLCKLATGQYSLSGSVGNMYVFNSSNPTFKLNGSSAWPITIYSNSPTVTIQAGSPGSNTTISVMAMGLEFCGQANASISIQSLNPTISFTGAPSICTETGNTQPAVATYITGATYSWWKKPVGSTNWGNAISTPGNVLTLPAFNTPVAYNIRCEANLNGCVSPQAYLLASWCKSVPFGPSCCSNVKRTMDLTEQEYSLLVKPNPSNGAFNLTSSSDVNRIDVYNINGQNMKSISGLSGFEFELNLQDLPDGMYFVQAEGTNFSEKKVIIIKK